MNTDEPFQPEDLPRQHDAKDLEKLKEQLARAMTDNEALSEQNAALQEKMQAALKTAQEAGDFSDLLHKKSQRLEQENVDLGKQRDRYKESFETQARKVAEMQDRLNRQKLLDKPETTTLG